MSMILIVEDEPEMAELIKDRLENEGFKVLVAGSGGETMETLKRDRPDLITLDVFLPDCSGLNILRMLRKDPSMFTIPVVIVSAGEDADAGRDLGAQEFIRKPVNFKRLVEVIRNCLHPQGPSMGFTETL